MIRAEILKHRSALILLTFSLIAAVTFIYAIPTIFLIADARVGEPIHGESAIGVGFSAMYALALLGSTSPIIGLLLGVNVGTREFRPETVQISVVTSRGWARLVAAKLATLGLIIVVAIVSVITLSLAASAVASSFALENLPAGSNVMAPPEVSFRAMADAVFSVAVGLGMWCALGFLIGSLARSSFTAVAIAVAWVAVEAFWISPFLPGTAQAASLDALTFVSGRYSSVYGATGLGLSWLEGALAALGWTVLFVGCACLVWRIRFRDVRVDAGDLATP